MSPSDVSTFAPGGPSPLPSAPLSAAAAVRLDEVLAGFGAGTREPATLLRLHDALREAGIRPSASLRDRLAQQGFDARAIRDAGVAARAPGPPPPPPPGPDLFDRLSRLLRGVAEPAPEALRAALRDVVDAPGRLLSRYA
jgi:hypothetical protein